MQRVPPPVGAGQDALEPGRARACRIPLFLTLGVVAAWHWPILAQQQPAGSDITDFFYGLMTHYADRLADGELPLWNPHWGFGFPALAESQMGVFYPPHLLLYGLFDVDLAYSLNMLVHALMAAGFAFWCGRVFGLRPWGAALAAIVFARGGFFVTQTVHQWAYTSGSWLPLAMLLCWKLTDRGDTGTPPLSEAKRRPASGFSNQPVLLCFCLSLVFALQMLAGHFQLAFYTQVTVLLMAATRAAQGLWSSRGADWHKQGARVGLVLVAWAGALGLAAVQLLPTAELTRYSSLNMRHNFSYLSHGANPLWHFVNYFFPLLWHRNTLWRTIVWDPHLTSPEESLVYVGLLPLSMALGAIWYLRKDRRIQVWTVLLLASVALSLGPFFPGFRALILLPGFGWFRVAARWSIVSHLVLGLMAGFAVDRVDAARLGRWVLRFAAVWAVVLGIVIASFVFLAQVADSEGLLPRSVEKVWRLTMPWKDRADLHAVIEKANTVQEEIQVVRGLLRLGYRLRELSNDDCTLARALPSIAVEELAWSAAALAGAVGLVLLPGWGWKSLPAVLVVFSMIDLSMLGLVHRFEWVQRGSVRQSQMMRWLSEHAEGKRVVAPFLDNLPIAAGATALIAYRTLDIPAFRPYLRFVGESEHDALPKSASQFLRLAGTDFHIVHANWPHGMRAKEEPQHQLVAVLSDPTLDQILLGEYAEQRRQLQPNSLLYRVYRPRDPTSRCWTIPASQFDAGLATEGTELPDLEAVQPARLIVDAPERIEIELEIEEPSLLVLTDLYYPGWHATVSDDNGQWPAPLLNVLDGARGIELKKPGRYRVQMSYRPASLRWGTCISAVTLAGWGLVALGYFVRRKSLRRLLRRRVVRLSESRKHVPPEN